jgi:two-component sensor histidine kinase
MHDQMVVAAEQATAVAVDQLNAILTAAEELLQSTEEKLKERADFEQLATSPAPMLEALNDIEETLHGTGFSDLAAIDRSSAVVAIAGNTDLIGWDFSGQGFMQRALDGEDYVLSEPISVQISEKEIAPLVHWVTSSKDEPLFLLMTLIDVRFLQNFQLNLQSSIIEHVALLDRAGQVLVGTWPFDDAGPADVETRRGVGKFDLVAAAGFRQGKIFSNLSSEFLLLGLTCISSLFAVTALSYAYACRAQVGDVLNQIVEQKDVLHREAQHRVSGALQLISSLVSLQVRDAQNERVALALDTIKHRISAILAINSKLSSDVDGRKVDLGHYLRSICDDLSASYDQKVPGAHLEASLSSVTCDGEKAIRIGLIVNELITNAYRHGFPEDQEGVVDVRLGLENERFHITVTDDGVGLPAAEADAGIGLELVSLLAEQLDCTIEQQPSDQGAAWRLDGSVARLQADDQT